MDACRNSECQRASGYESPLFESRACQPDGAGFSGRGFGDHARGVGGESLVAALDDQKDQRQSEHRYTRGGYPLQRTSISVFAATETNKNSIGDARKVDKNRSIGYTRNRTSRKGSKLNG